MFNVILYQPEIPPNTGNIIRLCANTGCYLHLIEPLGFTLDTPQLKRAGLDHFERAQFTVHASLEAYLASRSVHANIYAFSSKVTTSFASAAFKRDDALLFGPETKGLPESVLSRFPKAHQLTIPIKNTTRSLNLSNAVAIAAYEGLRQNNYEF